MDTKILTSPLSTSKINLHNRVAMAPMNRRRAINGVPGKSAITYYQQRAGAGLIITDNTAIAANGGAYLHTPGIYNSIQQAAWKKVADAVHQKGGTIFMQLVHAGRIGHPLIQDGAPLIAPTALAVKDQIRVPDGSHQPMTIPIAIDEKGVQFWVDTFVNAAIRAIAAGFDGIEIHAGHGFLIDQFLNPHSNLRMDKYGGNFINRSRFLLEVTQHIAQAIGPEKTGIRLSPFRSIYDLETYPEELAAHQYLLDELQKLNILYVHFSNAIVAGKPTVPVEFLQDARQRFHNLIMVAGGFTAETAESLLQSGLADLVAFGKPFISNPDLVERFKNGNPLADWDESTFYTSDDQGYTDYPSMSN